MKIFAFIFNSNKGFSGVQNKKNPNSKNCYTNSTLSLIWCCTKKSSRSSLKFFYFLSSCFFYFSLVGYFLKLILFQRSHYVRIFFIILNRHFIGFACFSRAQTIKLFVIIFETKISPKTFMCFAKKNVLKRQTFFSLHRPHASQSQLYSFVINPPQTYFF
jgi:hypothetical protein